jgi:hypothetical protein
VLVLLDPQAVTPSATASAVATVVVFVCIVVYLFLLTDGRV